MQYRICPGWDGRGCKNVLDIETLCPACKRAKAEAEKRERAEQDWEAVREL